jgi:hypothetical protein
MSLFRWSIAGMMGMVLACAVGFAALRHPTILVASAAFTVALTVLLFAVLAALRGRHRTFWLGFALAGWAYLYISVIHVHPFRDDPQEPYLLTSRLLNSLRRFNAQDDQPIPPGAPPPETPPSIEDPSGGPSSGTVLERAVAHDPFDASDIFNCFFRIGHSLAAIVHGFAGGIVIVLLERSAKRSGSKKEDPRAGVAP